MAPIKIILFDDNKRIRDSLEILFTTNPEFDWQGAFADASEAIDLLDVHSPNVVLMDIDMPQISGIEATQNIKKKFPDQVIIMLTMFDDDEKIFNAISAGASGHIMKSKPLTCLISAVKHAYAGNAVMKAARAHKVLHLFRHKNDTEETDALGLTYQTKEELKHLAWDPTQIE